MCLTLVGDMKKEATATPASVPDTEELTLEDFDAWAGVVPDRTGDYAAGRTTFHASGEELLTYLETIVHKSD